MHADMPELTCQWCGRLIPERSPACSSCSAARPREDLVVHGVSSAQTDPLKFEPEPGRSRDEIESEEERAKAILKEMDAYIPEETPAGSTARPSDPAGDAFFVVGVLAAGAVIGGLSGWLLAPPVLHEFFQEFVGVDSDGPEAFRRLGAFIGALVAMLFGALLTTLMRR